MRKSNPPLLEELEKAIKTGPLIGTEHKSKSTGASFRVAKTYNFDYTDPIDKSVSKNQGQVVTFEDGAVVSKALASASKGARARVSRYFVHLNWATQVSDRYQYSKMRTRIFLDS